MKRGRLLDAVKRRWYRGGGHAPPSHVSTRLHPDMWAWFSIQSGARIDSNPTLSTNSPPRGAP